MTAIEEIENVGRRILARHGLADHRISYIIYKEHEYNTIESVIRAVCEYYNYTLAEITFRCNKAEIAHPRKVLAYALFYWAGLHDGHVGKLIKRSRVAAFHSRSSINGYLTNDKALFNEMDFIRGMVNKYDGKATNQVKEVIT